MKKREGVREGKSVLLGDAYILKESGSLWRKSVHTNKCKFSEYIVENYLKKSDMGQSRVIQNPLVILEQFDFSVDLRELGSFWNEILPSCLIEASQFNSWVLHWNWRVWLHSIHLPTFAPFGIINAFASIDLLLLRRPILSLLEIHFTLLNFPFAFNFKHCKCLSHNYVHSNHKYLCLISSKSCKTTCPFPFFLTFITEWLIVKASIFALFFIGKWG